MKAVLATFFQNDVKSFCLQIAEDDGEVDLDFPGVVNKHRTKNNKISDQYKPLLGQSISGTKSE